MINFNSSIPFKPVSEEESIFFNSESFSKVVPFKLNSGFNLSNASGEIPLLNISVLTPSLPILSNLSKATVKSISLSSAPITSAIPLKILRLFNLMVTPTKFSCSNTSSYN